MARLRMSPTSGERYPCPCCGQLTLDERGHFDICDVCRWEDDPIQGDNTDYRGGANVVSLNQARENYARYRHSDPKERS